MYKRKLLFLPALLCLLLSLYALPASADEAGLMAAAEYNINFLTAGQLSATVTVAEINVEAPRAFIAALIYCDADANELDMTAAQIETAPVSAAGGLYTATAKLSLDIPADVCEGQYARVIVVDALSLEPVELSGARIEYAAAGETAYTGMFERYYTLDADGASVAVSGKSIVAADAGTAFRLKDMAEGYVSFEDASGSAFRLAAADGSVSRKLYGISGSTSMLWQLVPAQDGSYYIRHYSGDYLSVSGGSAVLSNEPCAFRLNFVQDSPFTLMTSMDGFKLLSKAEQSRIIEIYTSVGAEIFPQGTNSDSILDDAEDAFTQLYLQRDSLSPEEQRDKILEIVRTPSSYNAGTTDEITSLSMPGFPGGSAEISKSEPVFEKTSVWGSDAEELYRIDVTYTTSDSVQTVKVYCEDTSYSNVDSAINALAIFPYEYRQYIEELHVIPSTDENSAYYCDGPVLTVRLRTIAGSTPMARNFAHELGHSVDSCANGNRTDYTSHWCQSDEWQQALTDDIASVSKYGNTNDCEGFAEFARLYFQSYGNRERQIGIKQLYPNRLASFEKMLDKIGMEHLY